MRWYVRYWLSYADVVEWLAERAAGVDRSTVYRWVQRSLPLFEGSARPHRDPTGGGVAGGRDVRAVQRQEGVRLRAIDQGGQVADVYFSERQSAALAGSFFGRAIVETGVQPACVTTDKAKCYPPAMKSVLPDSEPR